MAHLKNIGRLAIYIFFLGKSSALANVNTFDINETIMMSVFFSMILLWCKGACCLL